MAVQTNDFLNEIRTLSAAGDAQDALELLDAYLEEHADDIEARLLKAELCLDLEKHAAFVGQTLTELEPISTERVTELRHRANARVVEYLADGRTHLKRGYLRDALNDFDTAIALAGSDPAIPLAAGIALLNEDERDDLPLRQRSRPLQQSRNKRDSRTTEAIEHYFQLALNHASENMVVANEASQRLAHHFLAQKQIAQALTLLDDLPSWTPMNELRKDISAELVADTLETLVALLRIASPTKTEPLLKTCVRALPEISLIHLLHAEAMAQAEKIDAALIACRRALKHADQPIEAIALDTTHEVWEAVRQVIVTCAQCGKPVDVQRDTCEVCGFEFATRDLLLDQYDLEEESETVAVHLTMAELFAAGGQTERAIRQIDAILKLEPDNHRLRNKLHSRQNDWLTGRNPSIPANESMPSETNRAASIAEIWERDGLTTNVLADLERLCDMNSVSWSTVALKTRRALVRALIAANQLILAQRVYKTVFEDNPERKTVIALGKQLADVTKARLEKHITLARQALADNHTPRAIEHTNNALKLQPTNLTARLIRGQARLVVGQYTPALNDFRNVIGEDIDPDIQTAAVLGAARSFELQQDYPGALAMLQMLNHEQAEKLRQRIERRMRGEPVIVLRDAEGVVMHDTLSRQDDIRQTHGFFAVAVRAVGRPWSNDRWTDHVLNAGYEFVQALGGLRNTSGDPIFALRLVSEPNTQIPERGTLRVAIMARVSAENETACRKHALNLWRILTSVLPLTQDHVYTFEAVADEAELESLLIPFKPTSMAEIVRREDVPQAENDRYAVYPFTLGSVNLHNLCWTLLRQPAAAMLSIHLLPTNLMAWEHTTLNQMMQSVPDPVGSQIMEAQASVNDPISQWWRQMAQWGPAQANRYLLETLSAQAFVMRVSVASTMNEISLLPELVASALFGPLRQSDGIAFGGYEIIRANTATECDVMSRNLAMLDVEGWGYSAAPHGIARLRHMVSEHEVAIAFRLPVPARDGVPGMEVIDAKPVAPPADMPLQGTILGKSVAQVGGMPLAIIQGKDDRRRHSYVVGKTGTGKSTLLQNMALQDIEDGQGVCVIDPHGDLVEDILLRIPAHRLHDVILFDPSDELRPIGLNLLEAHDEAAKQRIINEFIGLLKRLYDPQNTGGIVGPRFQHNVRNAMLTAMSVEGSTLIEVVRALTDMQYVQSVLPQVKDPLVRSYWTKQIANTSDFHKSEVLDYIVSKFSHFVGDSRIRNIIGQRRTTLDYRRIMDERQILLVNLSKGKIGPESAQFLGLLLTQGLLITALSRTDRDKDERPDFFLYVDEFQNFATDMFATVLSEGRKYGIAVTVANQYLTQLPHTIREAVFGNVGSIIGFRVGMQDANAMAAEYYPVFSPDDMLNLPKFTACVKLLIDGIAARPFTMHTLADTRQPDYTQAKVIRENSRQLYGRDVNTVRDDVIARFAS